MRLRSALLAAVMVMLGALSATAQVTDPNALAPYRFQPPPQTLSPLEQQKALNYRNQVQSQLRQLEQQRAFNGPNAVDDRLMMDTRRDLDRMNRLIQQ